MSFSILVDKAASNREAANNDEMNVTKTANDEDNIYEEDPLGGRRGVTLVDIIKGFSSSYYLTPFCTYIQTIVLFMIEFHLSNKFILR